MRCAKFGKTVIANNDLAMGGVTYGSPYTLVLYLNAGSERVFRTHIGWGKLIFEKIGVPLDHICPKLRFVPLSSKTSSLKKVGCGL